MVFLESTSGREVFLAFYGFDYKENFLGVFSTKELAENYLEKVKKEFVEDFGDEHIKKYYTFYTEAVFVDGELE